MFRAPVVLGQINHPPSHHAGALESSHRVGRGLHRLERRVWTLSTPAVLGVWWRFLSSWIGGGAPYDDFRVEGLWAVLLAGVVAVPC